MTSRNKEDDAALRREPVEVGSRHSEHKGVHLMAKVAINGLGRIGRATLKIVLDTPGLDLVAANDVFSGVG